MKLSPLTIILIGVAILIMALSYGFFQHYMPNSTEAKFYNDYAAQLESEGNKLPQAESRLKKAEELVTTKAAEWRAVVSSKTPLPDVNQKGINLNVDAWQLTTDTKKFRDNIQRAVNAQLVKGGVKVIGNGPQIPTSSDNASDILSTFYNYPSIAFPVTIFELGQVTVEGREDQIMENVRAWKNMPRYLAVTDGLQITGTSPLLRGTYSVTLVGFIRGKQIFPTVPEGAAPAGGAGGGGAGRVGGAPGAFGPPTGFGPPAGFGGPGGAPPGGRPGVSAGGGGSR
ncbi:MAG: hypothetical protein H7Y17_14280 [Chlorobia bacterium]|nr:hypothetical protein [Fimbriimonadaceae bacterium]